MLMMVLCDREGRIYDVWISFGSVHEVRAFRERKRRSLWFRKLVESCVVYGDRALEVKGRTFIEGQRNMSLELCNINIGTEGKEKGNLEGFGLLV